MDSVDVFEVLPRNLQKKLVGVGACALCVIGCFWLGTRDAIVHQIVATVNAHFQAQAAEMSKAYLDSLNKATTQSLRNSRAPVAVHSHP